MAKVDLFGGLNSIGMPYTKDNKDHIGYFDIVEEYLKDEGFDVNGVNMSRLTRNSTWDLERIFDKNYALSKIKNFQLHSIDAIRNTNALFKLIVPKKFKNTITIDDDDKNIRIADVYKSSEQPIFLYSTGSNDFLTYVGAGPVEMLNSNIREKMYSKVDEACRQTMENVDKNFKMLTSLNPNVQIYAIGTFYAPIYSVIAKVISLQNKFKHINTEYDDVLDYSIRYYNDHLEGLCNDYDNIHYVDVSYLKDYCANFDFHPNVRGNDLIGQQIIKELDKNKNIKRNSVK